MTLADVSGARVSKPPHTPLKLWLQTESRTTWYQTKCFPSRYLSMLGRHPRELLITEIRDPVTDHVKISAGPEVWGPDSAN